MRDLLYLDISLVNLRYRISTYGIVADTYDIVGKPTISYVNLRHCITYNVVCIRRPTISYTIYFSKAVKMCRPAGPVPPRAPDSSDEDGERPWNSDDERDYQDQQSPPPSPMQHYIWILASSYIGVLPDITAPDIGDLRISQYPTPISESSISGTPISQHQNSDIGVPVLRY